MEAMCTNENFHDAAKTCNILDLPGSIAFWPSFIVDLAVAIHGFAARKSRKGRTDESPHFDPFPISCIIFRLH